MRRIEQFINSILFRFPILKKIVKRLYQIFMYIFSKKINSEGNIIRVSPNDEYEYFFGYYDKSPWDLTNRFMLCMKVKNTLTPAPLEPGEIVMIDTHNNNAVTFLAKTNTWNVQQGCMAQWLEGSDSRKIIYNDFRDNKYCSVVLDIDSKSEKVYSMPIYSVSSDGRFALSLDFSRLHRLRKGYGYANIKDEHSGDKCPDSPALWKINLLDGQVSPLLKYSDFVSFEPRKDMEEAEHKINHIMLSPNGKRFLVMHRWFKGNKKYTRLLTVDLESLNMYNLSDDDMASHCCWKNNEEVLGFINKKSEGCGYYLMKDKTQDYVRKWPSIISDGHPTYSPNGKHVVTDTYPNSRRIAFVYIMNDDKIDIVAKVFAPFKYDNDVRCDLHPRWDREGDKICIDSVFEGKRRLYVIDVGENNV